MRDRAWRRYKKEFFFRNRYELNNMRYGMSFGSNVYIWYIPYYDSRHFRFKEYKTWDSYTSNANKVRRKEEKKKMKVKHYREVVYENEVRPIRIF